MRKWAATFLIFLLANCGWQEVFGQVSPAPAFTPSQPSRPMSPSDRLADPNRSVKAKIEVAQALLTGGDEQAIGVLKDFLSRNDNHSAQVAIAEAVTESQDEHKELFEPLLAVLLDGDPTVKAPVARAMVRLASDRMLDRLLAVAHDRKASPSGRLELVKAFHLVPDWHVLDALVVLTDDEDAQIRQAAADSLARLTNITDFADDPAQWKQWWEVEKSRDRTALLADIAVRQARRRASLEADNARLRERLGAALSDLYAASPPAQRQTILLGFLKDSLSEVRLAGLQLADRQLAASEEISSEIRQEAKDLLADGDCRVRQETAIVVANLADGDALTCLLDRLKVENSTLVRCSLVQALGQLRQSQALPAVLAEVDSKHPDVAAAAAAALAHIAGAVELGNAQRTAAAEAMVSSYRQVRRPADEADLREALLSAMGVVGDGSLSPLLREALLDKNAKVRLAAAISLGKVGKADAADSWRL